MANFILIFIRFFFNVFFLIFSLPSDEPHVWHVDGLWRRVDGGLSRTPNGHPRRPFDGRVHDGDRPRWHRRRGPEEPHGEEGGGRFGGREEARESVELPRGGLCVPRRFAAVFVPVFGTGNWYWSEWHLKLLNIFSY